MENQYTGVFEQVDNWWTRFVEELPGCNVQEATLDEARASLKEAIQEILQANREYLLRHLAEHGCELFREGGRHAIGGSTPQRNRWPNSGGHPDTKNVG